MVKLSLLDSTETQIVQFWSFESRSRIRIGRAPDNDVVVTHNLVSRYHLELNVDETSSWQRWQLTNLGKNGTLLNGVLVSQAAIEDKALIQLAIGGPILKFEASQASASPPGLASGLSCTHQGNAPENLFCIYCGQLLKYEKIVRQYYILRALGRGGMGTTYLAWNSQVGAQASARPDSALLVLKELNTDMAQIAKARELFEREARTLRALNHPGIPTFYDFFEENGKRYLAMELIHGQDLEQWVYQHGPCTLAQGIEWAIQTCEVLQYLHTQRYPVIHRDIKPANLLLRHRNSRPASASASSDENRRIVVIDFGAVKEMGTPPGTRIGAEGYSAPEQDLGRPVPQSDLYAIGPTLVFLLTGQQPGQFYRKQGQFYRLQLEDVPTITPALRATLERVTEPRAKDRYQSAHQLALALADCLEKIW
ncbi:MAG: protein kinase [Desertifilum sp. SIO1I2]|nr:protein kinase [Desertifilum sp. SIO1I2]